ncbi:MAG: hypothetical protein ACOCXJ_06150, partial [Planctomycetota bacterium]
ALLNQRELDSIAKQCGRAWAMTETCGGGGYSYALRDMKPLEDYCLALGVNLINPHICDTTLAGHGKYDWPQTISDHAPWFADYRRQCDHNARVVCALRQGTNRHRLLVLMPTTTAWCLQRVGGDTTELDDLRESQVALLEALEAQQIDYDLGDEAVIAELGRVEGGRFVVGDCAYDAVLLPPGCRALRSGCLRLLRAWADGGGALHALCPAPQLVDGRAQDSGLAGLSGWTAHAQESDCLQALRTQLPPRISAPDGSALPAGMLWRLVEAPAGQVLFCCNPWTTPWRARMRLPAGRALLLDTADGSTRAAPVADGVIDVDLPPAGHCLIYCSDALAERPVVTDDSPAPQALACSLQGVERERDNILVLDYCDLQVGGRQWPSDCVTRQDQRLWQELGVSHTNKPYRDRHLRRHLPALPLRLGFICVIDATVAGGEIGLLVERPWLWRISVNGQDCDPHGGSVCFDHDWRRLAIGPFLQAGANRIELHCEQPGWWQTPMPVYLLGDMALASTSAGWQVQAPVDLQLGDCGAQGLPCYPWGLQYRYRFQTSAAGTVQLRLPTWAGSVARCRLDGRRVGSIVFAHERLQIRDCSAGDHELAITVQGHLGNMMGPHHFDGLPGVWSWLAAPEQQPSGADYHRREHGLLADPELLFYPA